MEDVLQLFRDALSISEPLYKQNEQLWHKWNSYYVDVEADSSKIVTSEYLSPSFSMLVKWVKQQQGKGISSLDIFKNIDTYKVTIHETIDVFIAQEFRNDETDNTKTHTPVVEPDANIVDENYLEVNNSAVYYKLRDGIAKNQFEEDENTKLKSYPIETKDSNGVAQLSSHKDEASKVNEYRRSRKMEHISRWCNE